MDVLIPTVVGLLALVGMGLGLFFLATLTATVAKRTEGGGAFAANLIAALLIVLFLGVIWIVTYSLGRFISG